MDMSSFNENKNDYGIITSRNYPTWISDENCNGKIIAPVGYVIRVYVNDYNMEGPEETDSRFEFEKNNHSTRLNIKQFIFFFIKLFKKLFKTSF